jgi:predicted O-methyltransferase YrrM
VAAKLGGQSVDFLFIDGDHSYNGVKADFDLYAPLVRRGGMIALHDIVADHRTRFGRDTGCYAGEVYRYWAELKARYRTDELIQDPEQDGFGIGVVYVD